MRRSWRPAGAWLLSVAMLVSGCSQLAHPPPSPPPPAELSLQPVGDGNWRTYQAVLVGTYTDPAASYEGFYPDKKGRAKFRIEVRVPRHPGADALRASLVERADGKPPAEAPYVVVHIYAGSPHLLVRPARITPRAPCGPAATPPSAISLGVHVDTSAIRATRLPAGSQYQVQYTRIFVRFDADPGQLAACSLDFTAAFGDGKVAIPPLRLVSDTVRQYSPTVNEAPGGE